MVDIIDAATTLRKGVHKLVTYVKNQDAENKKLEGYLDSIFDAWQKHCNEGYTTGFENHRLFYEIGEERKDYSRKQEILNHKFGQPGQQNKGKINDREHK